MNPEELFGTLLPLGDSWAVKSITHNEQQRRSSLRHDGKLKIMPPLSKAGQSIEFQAEMDLIVAVSACSAPRANNFKFDPIGIEIIS